ncbi:MAG TPA: gliding motility-associated ABC transporter substrate-binding protein GldG [Prolixibacteraceae bacterium]|nr:gliding motility-associated ABC transporter substrate-binding protein GldG [Prolixibacteraceae bacterium]HCR90487.1 gliding motility-associated ABC transporter substrate-binding protein GldG [Prolixibacteraceae bacterium]HCU62767.1 gliding motility-associated ABC transporter substrate-binding protein GldG [Prolixibacteraceae bacterium]
MYSLFKKEISGFFGSLTGYLVMVVFLLTNGLFLWVFPGNYNILEGGYARLDGLFTLAPWVYLFLVPAVTMRLFAEEKRMGTLELLVTRPLSTRKIVAAKYLAGLVLVIFSLLPTLLYFYSVYRLGNPVGSIDTGGTWGAFIGLFFLAAIYVAIGVLASSVTDNQIFAFILAMALSFLAYMGFDFIGSTNLPSGLQNAIVSLGINEHYLSISRGVVDSRDLVYFLLAVLLFLYLTGLNVRKHKIVLTLFLKRAASVLVLVILCLFISANYFFRIDLTAEKRYSLNPLSKEIVAKLNEPIYIDLFLAGDLHPGLQKFQKEIKEKIVDYNAYSGKRITLNIVDPYEISMAKDREKLFGMLSQRGLQPVDLQVKTEKGTSTRYIFPGILIHSGNREIALNLLKNDPMLPGEQNLNNSVESLEYEFTNAFNRLINGEKQTVAFLTGHEELGELETEDIRQTLSENYEVVRLAASELTGKVKTLVIADPEQAFEEKDKLLIDQYVMQGGRLLWLIDPVQVSLDSLQRGQSTLAFSRDLNLSDQLFKYGVRLNQNLVQDAECMMIPLNVAPAGSQKASYKAFPWHYSPLLLPSEEHVIGRSIRRVKSEFVSSIDTVGHSEKIKKQVILATSPYSRILNVPLSVSLASVANPPARELFKHPSVPVGILLEGQFSSVFKNRLVESLGFSSSEIKTESENTRMIVLADGNLIANQYSMRTGKPEINSLGYDIYSKQTFGNKEFLVNAINYLCDDSGLMALKSRVFTIRLLDKVKINEQKLTWQLVNLLIPIGVVLLFGLLFNFLRARRYKR